MGTLLERMRTAWKTSGRLALHRAAEEMARRCSYCWGVAEYEDEWLKWNCCPNCGLKVNDGVEAKEWP